MKWFLFEVGPTKPTQYRLTAIDSEGDVMGKLKALSRDGFKTIGIYRADRCMEVINNYLKLEDSQ